MNDRIKRFLALMLGASLGCLASVAVLVFVFLIRTGNLALDLSPVSSPIPQDTADPVIYNLLAQTDQSIQAGNPQRAIDLIQPVIESWTSPIDRTTGYQLLAVAEVKLNQPQKAIPFAKKMAEDGPSSFSYMLLAQAYDLSGDLPNALSYYQQALTFNDGDTRTDLDYVRSRIISLSQTLGTPVPPVTAVP